jgi:hypothetical protein
MSTDNRRFALNVHRTAGSSGPTVHIFVQRIIRQPNGMLAVTPVCSSLEEIEGEVEELRSDLENILRQARDAYAAKRPSPRT